MLPGETHDVKSDVSCKLSERFWAGNLICKHIPLCYYQLSLYVL